MQLGKPSNNRQAKPMTSSLSADGGSAVPSTTASKLSLDRDTSAPSTFTIGGCGNLEQNNDVCSLVRRASSLRRHHNRHGKPNNGGDDGGEANKNPPSAPSSMPYNVSTFEPDDAFTEEENAILLRLSQELKTLQDLDAIGSSFCSVGGGNAGDNNCNYWDEETIVTVESKHRVSQSIKRMSLLQLEQELQQADDHPDFAITTTNSSVGSVSPCSKKEESEATATTTSLSSFLRKNNATERTKQQPQIQQERVFPSYLPGRYNQQNKYLKCENGTTTSTQKAGNNNNIGKDISGRLDEVSSLVRRVSSLMQRRISMQSDICCDGDGDDDDENPPPAPRSSSYGRTSMFEPNDAFTEEENAILLRLSQELKTLQDFHVFDSCNSDNWDESTIFTVESKRRVSQSIKHMSLRRLEHELQLAEEDPDFVALNLSGSSNGVGGGGGGVRRATMRRNISIPEEEEELEEERGIMKSLSLLSEELEMLQQNDVIPFWDEGTVATIETKRRVSQSIKRRSIQILEENQQQFQMQQQDDDHPFAKNVAVISPTESDVRLSTLISDNQEEEEVEEEQANATTTTVSKFLDNCQQVGADDAAGSNTSDSDSVLATQEVEFGKQDMGSIEATSQVLEVINADPATTANMSEEQESSVKETPFQEEEPFQEEQPTEEQFLDSSTNSNYSIKQCALESFVDTHFHSFSRGFHRFSQSIDTMQAQIEAFCDTLGGMSRTGTNSGRMDSICELPPPKQQSVPHAA